MQKTKVTYMAVDSLIPYANNPRLNDNAVDAVAASIKEFGFKVPIVVDGENVIINGHTRLKAAHKLGLRQVPVIVADDLTPGQVKALRLADNKTSELAEWDVGKLDIELGEIPDIDMGTFGFELDTGGDWFSRDEREYDEHEEGNDEYNDFVDKFKEKKTTDDCYTPDNVYEAVADFVAAEYGVKREDMVRPFFPGGDYRSEKYPEGCCVVDNPPFSILAEIQRFYQERGIPFFLFGPTLTIFFGRSSRGLLYTFPYCHHIRERRERQHVISDEHGSWYRRSHASKIERSRQCRRRRELCEKQGTPSQILVPPRGDYRRDGFAVVGPWR